VGSHGDHTRSLGYKSGWHAAPSSSAQHPHPYSAAAPAVSDSVRRTPIIRRRDPDQFKPQAWLMQRKPAHQSRSRLSVSVRCVNADTRQRDKSGRSHQPLITCPAPILKTKGLLRSRELSNFDPSAHKNRDSFFLYNK